MVISVKQTLATHLKLLRGLLRVPSDLICDCFEDYFEYREIPSTIAVSRILLEIQPNLAAKYSRSIRLCASFTFSFIQTSSGSKFYAENRKISRLNVVAEIFQKIYA